MNYYDRQTLNIFYEADKYGLPYFQDDVSLRMIRELNNVSFDDLVVIFNLSRPNLRPDVWERYKNGLWVDEVSMPEFTKGILVGSSGLLIFQEQLVDIVRSMTGWSIEKANEVRKMMGKKHYQKLEVLQTEFISECHRNPIASQWLAKAEPESGRILWNHLIECSPYLFRYKFALSHTIYVYQIAYNLTHQ